MHDIMLDRLIKFLERPGESEDCEAICQLIEKSIVAAVNNVRRYSCGFKAPYSEAVGRKKSS
jgi:hypothetical protein